MKARRSPCVSDQHFDTLLPVLCVVHILQVLNNLSQQLAGAPVPAESGSVHCLLLHLLPTAKAAGPVSMGRLKLSWRRKEPAKAGSGCGSSSGGSAGGSALAAALAALDGGATPAADVETSLELPAVVVQDSLLSAKAAGPQNVTAGAAFPFTLQVGCRWALFTDTCSFRRAHGLAASHNSVSCLVSLPPPSSAPARCTT